MNISNISEKTGASIFFVGLVAIIIILYVLTN